MPLTLVQGSALGSWGKSDTGTGSGTRSVSWFQGRTAGNLLLCVVNSDSTESTPTGWTLRRSYVGNSATYLFDRIADNTATDTPSFGGAYPCQIAWAEYSGNTAAPQDVGTSSGTTSVSGTSLSTGTTATTTQADELGVALWGSWHNSTPGKTFGSETNGYTNEVAESACGASGEFLGLTVTTKDLSSTGTQESTATPTGSCSKGGLIQTYKAAAAGGSTFIKLAGRGGLAGPASVIVGPGGLAG